MSLPNLWIEILSAPDEVLPLVADATRAADSDKSALGFLPKKAFQDAANQGKLSVAVVRGRGGKLSYAGHLLHGGAFPHARVFQVFTKPHFRRRGIARRLVEAIVERSERDQFMSVSARVAGDLAANEFWEHLGFHTVRTAPGGRATGRKINVRIRELSTPNLFNPMAAPPGAYALGIHLASPLSDVSPIYVLDLNVLLDLLKKRANAGDVERIFRASLSNLIRLAVTEELVKELERNSRPSPTDPILQFALALPRLPAPPRETLRKLAAKLGTTVFPPVPPGGQLRTQDQSDLIHLATAIHCRASGFVTGEKLILRAREALRDMYSLDIMGPNELADFFEPVGQAEGEQIRAVSQGRELLARPVRADDIVPVEEFLDRMRCPLDLAREVLEIGPGRGHHRDLVLCEGSIVGFGFRETASRARPHVNMFICADEDHPAVALTADFLLDSRGRPPAPEFPVRLTLRLLLGNVLTKRMAAARGFIPSPGGSLTVSRLHKVALGCVLTDRNWTTIRERLRRGTGLELSPSIPPFGSLQQAIQVREPSGQTSDVPLEDIEALFSPAIFLLPGRDAAIVPIRRLYADDLIGTARQLRLQSSPEAVMLSERVYFSSRRTASVLRKGTPILFYESAGSGGSGSVIAVARVSRTELVSKERSGALLRRGVLDRRELDRICSGKTVVASTIDNIMPFRHPVPLTRLRAVGAADGANFVTARPIRSQQLTQIVEEGMT